MLGFELNKLAVKIYAIQYKINIIQYKYILYGIRPKYEYVRWHQDSYLDIMMNHNEKMKKIGIRSLITEYKK